MKLFFLGYKLGMSQLFDNNGIITPITVIKVENSIVTSIKKKEIFGYNSVQFGSICTNNKLKKSKKNYFNCNGLLTFKYLNEIKVNILNNYYIGKLFDINNLFINDKIKISAMSIGKGYCGNIKRNNFKRGPMSHGSKHIRLQGSLGAGTTPGRVFPGKKMSGHTGFRKVTIANLNILDIDYNLNVIAIKGSIPGKSGNLLKIYL